MRGDGPDRTHGRSDGGPSVEAADQVDRWGTALELAAVAALVIGAILGAAVVLRSGWIPVEDLAWMELRVRDIPGNLPLNGVYSRFGGSHPGPAHFYLLWPMYLLTGGASASLMATTLLLHVGAAVLAWGIARSLDLVSGISVLVAAEVIILVTPVAELRTPWNPYVVLVLGTALVVLAWGTAQRHPWASALLLPVATVLVQSHVGTIGLVTAALVGAAAGAAIGWTRGPRVPWRSLAIGAGLAALAWLPPLVAQIRGDEGRFSELLSGTAEGGPVVGVGPAFGLLTRSLGPWPSWADPSSVTEPFAATTTVVPVLAVIVLAAWWVAWQRRDRCMLRGLAVATGCLVGAASAAAMLRGGAFGYLVIPVRVAGATAVALSVATFAGSLRPRWRAVARVGLGAAAVVLAVVIGARQLSSDVPWEPLGRTVERLTEAVLDEPVPAQGYVVVAAPGWQVGAEGLMLQLDRAGVDVVIREPLFPTQVGPHRRDDGAAPGGATGRTELTVAAADDAQRLRDAGWTIVAEDRPLSDEQRGRVRQLSDRLEALDGLPPEAAGDSTLERLALMDQLQHELDGRAELLVASRTPPGGP